MWKLSGLWTCQPVQISSHRSTSQMRSRLLTKCDMCRSQIGNTNMWQLLASAQAPFADPFLMEFEDPQSMREAYGGNAPPPPNFEQALMTARLEAQQVAAVSHVSSSQSPLKLPCQSPFPTLFLNGCCEDAALSLECSVLPIVSGR